MSKEGILMAGSGYNCHTTKRALGSNMGRAKIVLSASCQLPAQRRIVSKTDLACGT